MVLQGCEDDGGPYDKPRPAKDVRETATSAAARRRRDPEDLSHPARRDAHVRPGHEGRAREDLQEARSGERLQAKGQFFFDFCLHL